MTYPLMINAFPFIHSSVVTSPRPLEYFNNLVFHELLHKFLLNNYSPLNDFSSPILIKYSNEPPMILAHVHLFALQFYVYQKLNREEEFFAVIKWLNFPVFNRAWEIVQTEGVSKVLSELKLNAN